MIKEIASSHNPNYKRWLSLLESKGIKKEKRAIVSGEKLVTELLAQVSHIVEDLILPPKAELTATGPRMYRLMTGALFKELDVIGTKYPLAVVRVPEIEPWDPAVPPKGLELVVAMSDPSNLGAILRSAEAFGVSRVILTKESASPYLPKAMKASGLASLRLTLASAGSLAELPLDDGYALDMNGLDIAAFEWPRNLYLVLGEEGRGVPDSLALKRLKIPMASATESLNATVAGSIALYGYRSFLHRART
jgi:RNA methyltransferase, TrmH family